MFYGSIGISNIVLEGSEGYYKFLGSSGKLSSGGGGGGNVGNCKISG